MATAAPVADLDTVTEAFRRAGSTGLNASDVAAVHAQGGKITSRHRANAGRVIRRLLDDGTIVKHGTGRWRHAEVTPPKANGSVAPLVDRLPEAQPGIDVDPDEYQRHRAARGRKKTKPVTIAPELWDVMTDAERRSWRLYQAKRHEDDWQVWVPSIFPRFASKPMGPHHERFWEHVWTIEQGQPAIPYVAIWNRGSGKALALDTPLPTPTGWTTMSEVRPGDEVLDERGQPCRVLTKSAVSTKSCYRVRFKSGGYVDASGDHLWTVLSRTARRAMALDAGVIPENWPTWTPPPSQRICEVPDCGRYGKHRGPDGERWCGMHYSRWKDSGTLGDTIPAQRSYRASRSAAEVLTTEQILDRGLTLHSGEWTEYQFGIPTTAAFDLSDRDLPIPPWLLGLWLGDGTSRSGQITVGGQDVEEIVARIETYGYEVNRSNKPGTDNWTVNPLGLYRQLRLAGLLKNKHVPVEYLRAGPKQRADLLAGLLDSDGHAARSQAEFCNTNPRLAEAVHELAVSLGYRASINESRATLQGRDCGPRWRVLIAGGTNLFQLTRKRAANDNATVMRHNAGMHSITAIDRLPDQPVQCITVDSPNHLFLAGRDAIPTHNSATAEMATVALGARGKRRYALYVSGTQTLADEHVASIGTLLQGEMMELAYPALADRAVGKHGNSKGWRRNRLHTASGFVVDALGLDVAARGIRIDEQRPDLIILDDIDDENDTPATVEKKIRAITRKILPAGSQDAVVIAVQNKVHGNSIFARFMSQGGPDEPPPADFLARRVVDGPIPAVWDLAFEQQVDADGNVRWVIVDGTASWEGMPISACQHELDNFGLDSFLAEFQHEEPDLTGGIFADIDFSNNGTVRIPEDAIPELVHSCVWVDPAVTSKDSSDSCGIVVDALGVDRRYYRLWAWERRASPTEALRVAITAALDYGAEVVGVETDQGGDLWESTYRQVLIEVLTKIKADNDGELPVGMRVPRYESAKAGSTQMSKTDRAQRMRADYLMGRIKHVGANVNVLERGLRRFPVHKPFDVVDAAYWSWRWLAKKGGDAGTGRRTKARAATGTLPKIGPGQLAGAR